MPCALALYRVVHPNSIGAYYEMLCSEPLPGDLPLETWQGCLRPWALAKLNEGGHGFGIYVVEIVPIDERGRPDDDAIDDLIEIDQPPPEDYITWSGDCELVEATQP